MAEEEKKSGMMRTLIIVGVILVVDLVGGYLLGAKVIIPMLYKPESLIEETKAEEKNDKDTPNMPGIKKALEPINLNPSNSNGEIFSCDIVIEAEDQVVIDELDLRNYEIMDKLSTYLSFKTVEQLNKQENWDQYKQEMFDIVNNSLTDGKISAIYVPSKIIQFE